MQSKILDGYIIYNYNRDMTKADIVSEIARSTGIDKNTVLTSVESFMEEVPEPFERWCRNA